MNNSFYRSENPKTPTDEAGLMLQRAITQGNALQRAFHISLSRRQDAREWKQFETETAASLEVAEYVGHDARWFSESSGRLKASVERLLESRGSKSSRMRHYRRAADQVYESAAVWTHAMDELTMAYWRHCALVWITLWHIADVAEMTVEQARDCVSFAFTEEAEPEPEPELSAKRPSRWGLSAAANSIAGAFRKNASV